MKKNKDIEFAISNLEQVSGNEKLKRIAELKEKGRRDEQASLEYATEKGLKQGLEQGIELGLEQGIEKVILNMNKSGFTLEQIQKATNLELEEIKKILTTK